MDDPALSLALVYAWALEHPEHYSVWVNPYKSVKYAGRFQGRDTMQCVAVGGHFRKKIGYKLFPLNLRLTCHFDKDIALAHYMTPPLEYWCERTRDANGVLLPKMQWLTVVR